jgi:hypothetical protein
VSHSSNASLAKEAKKNGNQGKKECEETQAAKGKEKDKVEELRHPSFKYEIDAGNSAICLRLKGRRIKRLP